MKLSAWAGCSVSCRGCGPPGSRPASVLPSLAVGSSYGVSGEAAQSAVGPSSWKPSALPWLCCVLQGGSPGWGPQDLWVGWWLPVCCSRQGSTPEAGHKLRECWGPMLMGPAACLALLPLALRVPELLGQAFPLLLNLTLSLGCLVAPSLSSARQWAGRTDSPL